MELGALVVTQSVDLQQSCSSGINVWSSTWPVVGKTVLERWIERLRTLGVDLVSVVDRGASSPSRIHTLVDWAKQGVDQLLLILLRSYAEIDLTDLVQFHHQRRRCITRVFDSQGPLGINLLDRGVVLKNRSLGDDDANSARYDFLGYTARLSSSLAYRNLVQDALDRKCEIKPAGLEATANVWIDPTARVEGSVTIQGPCYIGARSILRAGVVVNGYSSVERDCEIDIGTTLECASVLPDTYLAPGLHVKNSVVGAELV